MNSNRLAAMRDPRLWLIVLAFACAAAGSTRPRVQRTRLRLDVLFVVDVTGSMNVRDYAKDGRPQSRLETVKSALVRLVAEMPCGSRIGLAVFSERRPFLLFAPMEACENFAPIVRTVSELDWRMAWEGDSYISEGIYKSIALAQSLGADIVFLTDGQESPPLPWSGPGPFEGVAGRVHGLLVGVGGYALSPIPKFDEHGLEIGFLNESDVPQELHSGLPPPGAEKRRGYNPRNAPFGADVAHGKEHLSSVHEEYLGSLARKTGLAYVHLAADTDLLQNMVNRAAPRYMNVPIDLTPWLAAVGLFALATMYLFVVFAKLLRAARKRAVRVPIDRLQPISQLRGAAL